MLTVYWESHLALGRLQSVARFVVIENRIHQLFADESELESYLRFLLTDVETGKLPAKCWDDFDCIDEPATLPLIRPYVAT